MPGTLHTVAFGAPATALLRRLVVEAKAGDPLAPVTVVVPSAAAGTTLRRRLAEDLGGLVGVSFRSLPQVAAQLAGPGGASPAVSPMVARAHLRAVVRAGTPLLPDPQVAASLATERALGVTFAELAGLPGAALDAMAAAEPQAAAAVVDLFRRYQVAIGAEPGEDVAGRAAARVGAGDADVAAVGAVIVFLPRRIRPSEAELVGALAARTPVAAVVGRTGDEEADVLVAELVAALAPALGPATDCEAPTDGAPPAGRTVPTKVVRAPDPAEEVAVAVREVVAALTGDDGTGDDSRRPVRPERIAVLHRVRHPYAGSLHAALSAAGVPHHVPSVTTLGQSVPGRVLAALLEVAAGDFRRTDVTGLWRSGPLVDPLTGDRIPASRWDRLARRAGIGGGPPQWQQRLDQAIAGRREQLAAWTPVSHDPPPDPDAGPDPSAGPEPPVDAHLAGLQAVAAHVAWLSGALAAPEVRSWPAWSAWMRGLLAQLLHPAVARQQPDAMEAVDEVLRSLADLGGIELPPDLDRLRRAVEPALEQPDRSHGRFGHGVLVGRLVDAVGADLDLVVVVGAADGRLPPRRAEDPLLPDRVRGTALGLLAPRGLRREEEHRDLLAALAAAPERVLVSHRSDPREQRERQPAAWFVAACGDLARRSVAGADLATLREHPWFVDLPSFEAGPAGTLPPASPRELDLADLLADHRRGTAASGLVATGDPALRRGLEAAAARRAGRFDEWSGMVGPAADALADFFDRPRSPTGLEEYALCPFRFLLAKVLRVGSVDDPAEAELISAMDEGALVHEVLERFIGESAGKPPDEPWSDAERGRLLAILDDVAGRYQAEGRTGRPLLWAVRLGQLRHQVVRVLDRDEVLRAEAGVSPAEVELAFGDEGSPPVAVTLASGRTVTFKGTIDRVDRSVDGRRLVVYDYKTGKVDGSFGKVRQGIAEGDLTARGTKLQLPIYALAARSRYPDAEEIAAHYWFVGRRNHGITIGAPVDERVEQRFREVLDVVVDGMERGCFPANPGNEDYRFGRWSHDHCSWCDFDRICPIGRGEAWVQVRTSGALARYVELAEGDAGHGGNGGAPS